MVFKHNSLSFRLGLVVNLTALGVFLAFGFTDYRRERRVHLQEQAETLREEAKVLRVARRQLSDADSFQRYIDAYCRQMERHISPGHHIVMTDEAGNVISRAHVRADKDLESKMAELHGEGSRQFEHNNKEFMVVGVTAGEGDTILVTQSLAPVKRVIHRQAISRAASITVLVALLMAVTNFLLWRLVRRPVRQLMQGVESVRQRHFDYRIGPMNTAELQFLADGFNRMGSELESFELNRQQEMAKARRIHLGLLPPESTTIPGLSIAARYIPTDSIGGDYYDMLKYRDGRWLIVIGDAAGHGVQAALVTAMIKALSRQAVAEGRSLSKVVQLLNEELESLTGPQHFVTFLAGLYNPETSEFEYINCGHEPGVILRLDGRVKHHLEASGLPLGIDPSATWEVGRCILAPGDQLYLVTDGLTELHGTTGELLGRDRLIDLTGHYVAGSPHQAVDNIISEVHRFHGDESFTDDVTLVTLWRTG